MEQEDKTYDQWQAVGYHVRKGMKSKSKTPNGICLFTYAQVEMNKARYCYGNLEDDINDDLHNDPYYGCKFF